MYKLFFIFFQSMSQEERIVWLSRLYEADCCPLASMKPDTFLETLVHAG